MRDARLVRDIHTGRSISADTVNRQYRRLLANMEALKTRYEPSPLLMWNFGHTRLVANSDRNREAYAEAERASRAPVEERRAVGIARTQERRNLEGVSRMFEEVPEEPTPRSGLGPLRGPTPVDRKRVV